MISTLDSALAGFQARTSLERADLARVRSLPPGDGTWSRTSPVHVTCSAFIVHPPTRRVLLRWHARQQSWLHVGGHADPGETDPLAIATREGSEETGLSDLWPWPSGALLHLVIVRVPEAAHEPEHHHADLRFVLSTYTPDAVRPEKPGAELKWLTMAEALALTDEENVRESLRRVDELFDATSRPGVIKPPVPADRARHRR